MTLRKRKLGLMGMGNILFAIDPSLTATGIAVFDADKYSPSQIREALLQTRVSKTRADQTHDDRMRYHESVADAMLRKYKSHNLSVIAEKQVYYPGMANPKTVALCQEVLGVWKGFFVGHPFETVGPATWQGALLSGLGKEMNSKQKSRYIVKMLTGLDIRDHNITDAILIGIWWLDHKRFAAKIDFALFSLLCRLSLASLY